MQNPRHGSYLATYHLEREQNEYVGGGGTVRTLRISGATLLQPKPNPLGHSLLTLFFVGLRFGHYTPRTTRKIITDFYYRQAVIMKNVDNQF